VCRQEREGDVKIGGQGAKISKRHREVAMDHIVEVISVCSGIGFRLGNRCQL
jgi:hypothetical protein